VSSFAAKVIHCLIKKDADETGIENEDSNKEPAKDNLDICHKGS